MSSYRPGMIKCFSEVNGRKLEPHSELGLFSLPKLHLLNLSQPNSSKTDSQPSLLPSGTPLVLPELLACLPVSLNELKVERRLIQGGLHSVQVHDHSDELGDQLVNMQVARAREMVARLASLKTIKLSGSAFIGTVAGRLGR